MFNIIEEGLRGQEIAAEENRKARVRAKVKSQAQRLATLDKDRGYTSIPHPISEETDEEYMKRIGDMNLRVAIAPLAKVLVKHEMEDDKC